MIFFFLRGSYFKIGVQVFDKALETQNVGCRVTWRMHTVSLQPDFLSSAKLVCRESDCLFS